MEGLEEWLPPVSAGTETGLSIAQVMQGGWVCPQLSPERLSAKSPSYSRSLSTKATLYVITRA